jgi:hypothetical protein
MRVKGLVAVGILMVVGVVIADAQAPELVDVEVEPITCWWRSSTTAVRSGEPFDLALTCAVVETESTRVVPDQSKLDPSVVQLQPFEVIGGSRAPDMRVPGRRFFQYDYRLRLINESAFGTDVEVPELEISYRIESSVSRGEMVQGRDLTYSLLPIAIRLISLVPNDALDIREAPAAAFAAVEAREARGDQLRLVSNILFALSGVVLIAMLVSLVRRTRVVARKDAWMVSGGAIAAAARRELAEVRQQSRGGWDTDLAGRALAALRLAASLVTGHAVGQIRRERGAQTPLAGQLLVAGLLGRGGAFVSGSVTAQTAGDEAVATSLRAFTVARYGRTPALDSSVLDAALDAAMVTASRAAAEQSWWKRLLARVTRG